LSVFDEESRQRGDSYSSSFDTPQNELEHMQSEQQQQQQIEIADDSDDGFNEDEMVVLVQHRGSDDELVIDIDAGSTHSNSDVNVDFNDGDGEDDGDLLDIPFARNGSITTIGAVSEGNMAFNSVTMDPSVSSLVSSSIGEEEEETHRLKPVSRRRKSSLFLSSFFYCIRNHNFQNLAFNYPLGYETLFSQP